MDGDPPGDLGTRGPLKWVQPSNHPGSGCLPSMPGPWGQSGKHSCEVSEVGTTTHEPQSEKSGPLNHGAFFLKKELPRNTEWGHSPHIFNIHLSAEVLEFLCQAELLFKATLLHCSSFTEALKQWTSYFKNYLKSNIHWITLVSFNLESYFLRVWGKKKKERMATA